MCVFKNWSSISLIQSKKIFEKKKEYSEPKISNELLQEDLEAGADKFENIGGAK